MRRAIGIIVLILVLFWVISQPTGAAATVNSLLANLQDAGSQLVTFVQALV